MILNLETKIIQLVERYAKYENILPEQLLQINFNELETIKDEIKSVMREDMRSIKKLSAKKNKKIEFQKFKNLEYLIELGFFLEGDLPKEDEKTYCAHWYMGMVTLRMLSESVFVLSKELISYYKKYIDLNTSPFDRKINRNFYVRSWMDFYGNIINIKETIYQYHDLFVSALNKIDPQNNAKTYYAFKSGGSADGLHAAVKELIILGNVGRLEEFSLLRSMLEIHITRELFNLSSSPKYKDKKVEFSGRDITSVNAICNCIDRLNLSKVFKTDIIRIYAWGSIVSHRGPRTDEYITWFIRGVAADLCDLFFVENTHSQR